MPFLRRRYRVPAEGGAPARVLPREAEFGGASPGGMLGQRAYCFLPAGPVAAGPSTLSAETFRLSTETSSSSDALDSALDATLSALVGRDAPIEARSHAEPPSGPPHAVPARIESSWSLSGEQTPFRGEHSVGARGDEARGLRLRTRFQLSGEAPGGAPLRII